MLIHLHVFQYTPSGVPRRANLVTERQEHISCKRERLCLMLNPNHVSSPLYHLVGTTLIYILVLVKGLDGKKIVQIACGQQHSVALDDEGYVYTILSLHPTSCHSRVVYVWGCNGYGRLGLGTGLQNDVLVPKVMPNVSIFTFSKLPPRMLNTVVVCRPQQSYHGTRNLSGAYKHSCH